MKIIYMWTAVEETIMKAILADMNTTELVVKIRPEVMGQSGRGRGFKSRAGLNFFQALFSLLAQ